MTINFNTPQREPDLKPRITVIGVGGAGGNAVNNMISSSVEGVEFIVANTDAQALAQSLSDRRIQLGKTITQGLGAGARPDVGRAAAEEALPELIEALQGSHMVFVAAGMGGGTGTGAAPVIAAAAREQGILTVGVVTKPFQFEGNHRMRLADSGIQELEKYVDTLIIIPNQNLFRVANEKTTFADAFKMADDVLCTGVRGVTDLMVMPGLINLDFADIRTVMGEMGKAMMGTGEAEGEKRALAASEAAISNPLLEDASMKGAKGVLINITGGFDMTLMEVDEAANRIREEVDPDANIIFGSTFEQNLAGRMRVSVVATGIQAMAAQQPRPTTMLSLDRNMQTGLPGSQPLQRPAPRAATPPVMAQPAPQPAPPAPVQYAPEPAPEAVEEQPLMEAVSQPQPQPEPQPQPQMAAAPEPVADWRIAARPAPEPPRPHPMAAPVQAPPAQLQPIQPQAAQPQPLTPQPIQAQPVPRATQPFIPPRPVEAPQAARAPAPRQIDAFAAAEMANAARAQQAAPQAAPATEQPARGLSLFQRMTGATRREVAPAAPPPPAPPPQAAAPTAPPPAQAAQPEPAARAAQPEAPRMRPVQPKLGGLDPSERLQSARAEEDMLDIPAFLRRQAN